MPANKDLKRLVRSRMQKTGESYTTARRHVTAQRAPRAKRDTAPPAPDFAALAGMKDETVIARTGCSWAKWVKSLDHHGAAAMNHTQIAALIGDKYDVSGWWAQMVTVGYERIRGLRGKNQLASGDFAANKNKTFAVPVAELVAAFAPKARAQWLDAKIAKERKTTAKVVRWIEADGSWVDVAFEPKGDAKCTVSVQHSRLPDRAAVETMRARWAERLDALGHWLARRT